MHLGTLSFARQSRRRRASRRVALLNPPQQFETRCLLAAATALPALDVTAAEGFDVAPFDADFGDWQDDFGFDDFDVFLDSSDFSDADLFADLDSAGDFGLFAEDVVFEDYLDELAGGDLPESFTLVPESIRNAVATLSNEREGVSAASDWSGLNAGDLRIISLQVTASSGVTLPVDLFVWDSEADAALSADFLAQVEQVLNDTLKDVLATGGTTSISDSGIAASCLTSATATGNYADSYGIQPLEIQVDVSQDAFSADGNVYISGVTVVSEDPLDPEFLIFDEYFFVAEDFADPAAGFQDTSLTELSPAATDSIVTSDDADAAGTSTADAAATDNPEQAAAASAESPAAAEAAESDQTAEDSRSDSAKLAGMAREQDPKSAAVRAQGEQSGRRDGNPAVEARRARHAQRFAQRTADDQSNADSTTGSRRQRFRVRVAEVAREIARAASASSTQIRSQQALPASTAAFALNWAGRLAAFAQPTLNDTLLGLSEPEADLNGDVDSGQPTCAQIASATGALLIAASATAQTVRQRQQQRNGLQAGTRSHGSLQDTNRIVDDDTLV